MKCKAIIMITVLVFVLSMGLVAETGVTTKPLLKTGDVEHFINTFPLLTKDLKALGAEYDAHSGDMTYPDAIKANSRLLELLKKHGWDEQFFSKASIIGMGYSILTYGKEYKKANPEIEKSLKEIESNPHLSATLKKQMKDAVMAAKAGMEAGEKAMTKMVDPADIKLISPFVKQLKVVLDKSN